MQLARRLIPFAAFLIAFAASVAAAQPAPGKDYRPIEPPQPTDSGKRIEVLEFFWYGCPHCNALQAPLKNWLKKKPLMETLDLVVVGAEWGFGRRANLIGSYTVACYDPETSNFLQVGKVGTGLTDEQLKELT